jgi:5'-deoxynucleotidase YfbR-like HD superfamily hydrolase
MSYQLETAVQRVKFAREAGAVRRLHIHRIIGEYDIAQHTYGALCLLRVLNPDAPSRLLWAILSHDKPERLTGDIPSPAKYNCHWFDKEKYAKHEDEILAGTGFNWDELTPEEEQWLKAIDALEFFLFCLDQEQLGHRGLSKPKRKIMRYIEMEIDNWPSVPAAFYAELKTAPWEMCDELG